MTIVGGLDIHRQQITYDYVDTITGEVERGQIGNADRRRFAAWLRRFDGRDDVEFAVEGCTGWRYVVEELVRAGITPHLAEPADTAAARGRKRHAKTDRTDSRLIRDLLLQGRCWSVTRICAATIPRGPSGSTRCCSIRVRPRGPHMA
jgi:transposase